MNDQHDNPSGRKGGILTRARRATAGYPRQFWLLLCGLLVSAVGGSIVWPFMTIYLRQRFEVPLTTVTALFLLNSISGIAATTVAGPVVDRVGRKPAMVVSLAVSALTSAVMAVASTLEMWALLMIVGGAAGPLYRIGSNAMVADLVEEERRASAYALLRTIANLGIAIGPAIGGFVTGFSYALAFSIAAAADVVFTLLIALFLTETMPEVRASEDDGPQASAGYGRVLRDWPFLAFCASFTFTAACAILMMVLLPVYVKENFGVPESQYGFIMATNAAMVVGLQYGVTKLAERYKPLSVLVLGSLLYGIGVGSVALGSSFAAFWLSMVIMTVGEMLATPTGTTLTANLAPPDMRGRYMGIYGLTWGIGVGIGPVIGGLANDYIAPVAIWYTGLAMGLVATAGLLLLTRVLRNRQVQPP